MDLNDYITSVRDELTHVAEIGGAETVALAQRLALTLDSSLRIALLDALADAAGQISGELAPGSVQVVLRDGAPEFVVDLAGLEPQAHAEPTPAPTTPLGDEDEADDTQARISLRIATGLKQRVDAAADTAGVSTNTWIARALAASVGAPAGTNPPRRSNGRRITGWVQ